MALDVMQAVIDEAHRLTLKVYVHAPQLARAKEALRAGVDGLMHGIIDEPIDQDFITLMKKNSAVYVPTLGMFEDVADVGAAAKRQAPYWDQLGSSHPGFTRPLRHPRASSSSSRCSATRRSRKNTCRCSGRTCSRRSTPAFRSCMGSDTGFFGVYLGVATQLEMELMVEGGLKPIGRHPGGDDQRGAHDRP